MPSRPSFVFGNGRNLSIVAGLSLVAPSRPARHVRAMSEGPYLKLEGMTRRGAIGLLAGVASTGAFLGGCDLLTSEASYRFRMTVEGKYSGSAVYEILAEQTNGPRLADEKPGGSLLKGEALVLKTPSGPVFALLRPEKDGEDLIGAITRTLAPDIPWNGQPNFWKAVKRLSAAGNGNSTGDLPRDQWPLMVRFSDITDPRTAVRVDPQMIGVKRVALATTIQPVTRGIERKVGWLGVRGRPIVWPAKPTINPTFAETLYSEDFKIPG